VASGCLVCEQLDVARSFAGGPLLEDDAVVAYHLAPNDRFPLQYLGRIMVVTRRHVDHLADLTDEETVAVALAARRVAEALGALEEVTRVHLALIGQHHPHFHLHVFPRYEWMPLDADWNALYRRADAPRGNADGIADFVARLRPTLEAPPRV
jgi:histidine triad (HIT) family protein